MAQHTQLVLTLAERLGSRSRPQCDLASQLLLLLLEDRRVKTEQVRPRGRPRGGGGQPASQPASCASGVSVSPWARTACHQCR